MTDDKTRKPFGSPPDRAQEPQQSTARRPSLPDHQWEQGSPTSAPPPQREAPPVEPPSTGAPPDLGNMDFTPTPQTTPTEDIYGHDVTPLTHDDLVRMHEEEGGGPNILEGSMAPNEQAIQQARRAQQIDAMENEVDSLTPSWMRQNPQRPPQAPVQAPPNRDLTKDNMPQVDMGSMKSVADAISTLNQQAAEAQATGNLVGARALREAMESIANSTEMQRKYESQEESPILQKLKNTLGIQKIKPISREWAGLKWHLYASNMVLDAWLIDNLWEDRRNFASLKVAVSCVGIDDVPLYKVFSVPMTQIQMVMTEEGNIQEVPIKPYRKYCKSCGIEIPMDVEECGNCGAGQDPFLVPLSLRLYCAEKLYNFFQEEFGPTEKLDDFIGSIRDDLADRFVDSAELYPLAMLSVNPPTTDGSPSGDAPSPEQESSQQTQEQ